MDFRQLAQEAAQTVGVLDDKGRLVALDSMALVDLMLELERLSGLNLAMLFVKPEDFASLDAIAALLSTHAKTAKTAG